MNKRTLGIINRITEGRYKLSDFKGDKLKKTESPVSHSTISKNDDVVVITKRHKPAVHTLHHKDNLYKTVRAVWNLTDALDIELSHNDIKKHVDKYVNSVRDEDDIKTFNERIQLTDATAMHKVTKRHAKVAYVTIGATICIGTVIPFIEYEYSIELEVCNDVD